MAARTWICVCLAAGALVLYVAVAAPRYIRAKEHVTREVPRLASANAIPAAPDYRPSLEGWEQSSSAFGPDTIWETVRGTDFDFSLQIPSTWAVTRKSGDFDIQCSHQGLSIGVIAEDSTMGTFQFADVVRRNIGEHATNAHWTRPDLLPIAGQSWLGFVLKCQIEEQFVAYQFYVHSGPNGSYQIVGWTTQAAFERDLGQLRRIMQSFRFGPR
jgi:hypothetical protein